MTWNHYDCVSGVMLLFFIGSCRRTGMSHIAMVFRHLFQQGGYLFGLVEIKQEYSKIESTPKEDSHLILAVFHWLEGCVPSAVGCVPLTGRGQK